MSRVPQTELVFGLLGLGPEAAGVGLGTEAAGSGPGPEAAGSGLQLQVSEPAYKTRGGKNVVVIKGFVVNISDTAREVPEMIVKVYDRNKKVVYEKRFSPSSRKLLVKERTAFATELTDPPSAGTRIQVTFDPTRPGK